MSFDPFKQGKKNRNIPELSISGNQAIFNLLKELDDTIPDFLGTINYTFNITNPTDQQILSYDAVKKQWKNTTLGSVTITYGNLDGGTPDANYGGTIAIDGGYYNSF